MVSNIIPIALHVPLYKMQYVSLCSGWENICYKMYCLVSLTWKYGQKRSPHLVLRENSVYVSCSQVMYALKTYIKKLQSPFCHMCLRKLRFITSFTGLIMFHWPRYTFTLQWLIFLQSCQQLCWLYFKSMAATRRCLPSTRFRGLGGGGGAEGKQMWQCGKFTGCWVN